MSDDPRMRRGFELRVRLARAVVAFERIWPAIWPAAGVAGLFLAVSLLDLWHRLPPFLHVVGLAAFAIGFALALWRARGAFGGVGPEAALARLERDSAIPHRALRALDDRLPEEVADPATRALWEAHRARLARLVGRLRVAAPRSALPARDPWALRAALLLLLVVALVDARGEYGARLIAAFSPAAAGKPEPPAVSVALWVTPPAYTRKPPIGADQARATDRLVVPAGSQALGQIHHLPPGVDPATARLHVPGSEPQAFTALGPGSGEAKATLERSGRLAIVGPDGTELGGWALEVVPDLAPTVAFVDEPNVTHRGVLRIAFEAADDYGVSEIALEIATTTRPEETERLPLAKTQPRPGTFASAAYSDLLAHPFAGLPVRMRLEAVDSIGQVGKSGPLEVVLPERQFRNPLARAVIEQRKALVATPEQQQQIGGRLAALAETQAAAALGAAVPLSLRVAALRTRDAQTREQRRAAVDLLWEIALYIEDGALSTAERELRALQERLERALAEQASDAELERLMAELQEALDRFLEELARQALAEQQDPTAPEQQPVPPVDPSQFVDRRDLQRMLDRARELMRSGQRDAAKQLLSQLRDMLENLQVARGQQRPSPEQKALSDLQKMIELQRNLLDRSHRMQQGVSGDQPRRQEGMQGQQGRQGQQGLQGQRGRQPGQQQGRRGQPDQGQRGQQGQTGEGQPMEGGEAENALPDSPGRAAAEQEGLRRALGELMRRMGEQGMPIPRELGQAELSMRSARDALGEGDPGRAVAPQAQALDLLQQGGQAMLERMQQQMGRDPGPGPGREPLAQGRRSRDPLGRSQFNDGGWDPRGELVPEEADLGRAREVLEELYRRSGERNRPPLELDYYKRLLDRF
jgi:uncharacterized protein (TIGR02302 family)